MWSRLADSLYHTRPGVMLAALSGVLYFVGFCGFDQFYLSWICLVPVMRALDDDSLGPWEALWVAWVFGLVTHLGGYTWITGMLRDFGHLPLVLALGGYLLLCLGQGSLLAAWGWIFNRLVTRLGLSPVWTAPVVMVLAEWAWPALFPSYLSNSQYRQTLFIQSLDLWGPLGLTFIVTLASAVVYQTLSWWLRGRGRLPRLGWAVLCSLLVANLVYGLGAMAASDDDVALAERRVRIGIVQTNMGTYQKASEPEEGLRRHREQSLEVEAQGAELVVWPESGYAYRLPASITNVKRSVMGPLSTPLLFGGIRLAAEQTYNSAFLADANGELQGSYDKTYLLAFGEHIPLGETFPFLYDLPPFRQTARFSRGRHTRPLTLDGVRYGVLICYEDILPGFVREVMDGMPHVLVNITNDAWFGNSREPLIHLALATFRAVETRRFLVRATNTGISAFVDPAGRIIEQTPVFARANLIHPVALLAGVTPYVILGDWVAVICLGALLIWLRPSFSKAVRRATQRYTD